MKKYLTNLALGIQVESEDWTMEVEMLNQAQGMNTDAWWSIWSRSGMESSTIQEGVKPVTLKEGLQQSIAVSRKMHQHDCDHCEYLGNWQRNAEHYDLYFCRQNGIPTVIARFGEEGDYFSGLSLCDIERSLREARDRATILGHLHTCPYAEDIEGVTKWCACSDEDTNECLAAI